MIDIIKVELYRLKKSSLFWVMLGLTAATPILSIFLNSLLYAVVGAVGDTSANLLESLREANLTAALLQNMTNISGDIALWSIIATAVVISKEFVDGTMRNVMLANKSRAELYFGYLLTSFIVSVTYLTAFLAVTLVIVAPIFGFGGAAAGKVVSGILCSFAMGILAMAFTEACVCMFVFAVRKQWAAILFPLLVWYAPAVLTLIIQIVVSAMIEQGVNMSVDFIRYLPFINVQDFNPLSIDGVIVGMNILYLVAFTAAFTCIGFFSFKKADLK